MITGNSLLGCPFKYMHIIPNSNFIMSDLYKSIIRTVGKMFGFSLWGFSQKSTGQLGKKTHSRCPGSFYCVTLPFQTDRCLLKVLILL